MWRFGDSTGSCTTLSMQLIWAVCAHAQGHSRHHTIRVEGGHTATCNMLWCKRRQDVCKPNALGMYFTWHACRRRDVDAWNAMHGVDEWNGMQDVDAWNEICVRTMRYAYRQDDGAADKTMPMQIMQMWHQRL
eukprot:356542-Chlamydomonas_euryale.AAC.2